MASREPETAWLSLDPRSLGLFRAALGIALLVDLTRRIAAALAELQATLFAALVLAGLIVAWFAAARFFLGHKTSAGETLWTWLAYLVAYYASSVDAPPADRVLACLLLWCVWLPVGDRWSLDALVRLARPPGESLRPERGPASAQAVLGLALQMAVILVGLAAAMGAGEAAGSAAVPAAPWILAGAALAALAAPCNRAPTSLRIAAALVLLIGVAANLAQHSHEAWAWTLLTAPVAFVPAAVWNALAAWLRPKSQPVTCYFDDDCGICQAVCRTLTALDRGHNITFIGNYDPSVFRHAVPLELTERTIVVFDEQGRMLTESRAVGALLAVLPWPWRAGGALQMTGLADLADFGYRWVARNRLKLSVQFGLAACGTGVKPSSPAAVAPAALRGTSRSATWAAILLSVMLWRAYNANVADSFDIRSVPEPIRLHALLQMALFDQEWGEVSRGSA